MDDEPGRARVMRTSADARWGAAAGNFGAVAEEYDRKLDQRGSDGHALRARLEAAASLAGYGPGDHLDVGMGPGHLVATLATRGWTVNGIDASPEMVELVRSRLPALADRVSCALVEELPFPHDAFDLVTATGVLEYSDLPRAVSELSRVLRPGGKVVVSYPSPWAFYRYSKTHFWYPLVRPFRRLLRREGQRPQGAPVVRPGELQRLLEGTGLTFETRRFCSALPLPSPLDLLFPRLACRLGETAEGHVNDRFRRAATQMLFVASKPPVS